MGIVVPAVNTLSGPLLGHPVNTVSKTVNRVAATAIFFIPYSS